jgi:hypothetical protein
VIWTLDIGPAIELKAKIWTVAFCTGLTVYLEALAALALLTEQQLHVAAAVAMVPVLIAQSRVIRRPARQFVDGRLGRAVQVHLGLALVFLALLGLGTAPGTARAGALILGLMVTAGPSWPALRALRAATRVRESAPVPDPRVIDACLSFDPRQWLAVRLRAFGGERVRWTAPFLAAAAAMAVTAAVLALLLQAIGVEGLGTLVAQGSTLVAIWVFYRTLRIAKLRAAALRQHDARRPVLVLRQFEDDMLGSGWLSPATFEQHIVNDLHRVGPAISIGEPGQRLQPLGAARDYLTDGNWKHTVGQLIDQAALVVFVLGSSESLVWELEETLARGRKAQVLVIAPPDPKGGAVERRWASFVEATAGIFGGRLPQILPEGRLLALFFAGEEVVMVVSRARERKRSFALARSLPEYRLWLRLRESLSPEDTASIHALQAFCQRSFPFVSFGRASLDAA